MTSHEIFRTLGMLGGTCMPLCNIPLILRIVKRKSSADISLAWVLGVEFCVLAMVPSALTSTDLVLKLYGISNSIFFSIVTVIVCVYHRKD